LIGEPIREQLIFPNSDSTPINILTKLRNLMGAVFAYCRENKNIKLRYTAILYIATNLGPLFWRELAHTPATLYLVVVDALHEKIKEIRNQYPVDVSPIYNDFTEKYTNAKQLRVEAGLKT
jgi:hypothetical protein